MTASLASKGSELKVLSKNKAENSLKPTRNQWEASLKKELDQIRKMKSQAYDNLKSKEEKFK